MRDNQAVRRNALLRSLGVTGLALVFGSSGCGGTSPRAASSSRPPATEIAATTRPAPPATTAPDTTPPASPATTPPPLLGPPPIVKSYIPFPQKRKNEMRAYALEHYGIDDYHLTDPHLVIWHYTATSNYQSVFNTFADDVPDVQFHELPQVCAHFVIDTDGTIHQLVPLGIMCRQVVGLNYTAIGIENVGESDQQVIDDKAQFRAALSLTRWLRCRFHIPVRNVIGHNESLQSPYYRELVPSFRGQTHADFNRADMNVVRAHVATLACRA
jgi:N-acetylmuramoyl-L-alanine amidase-like protein